MTTIVKDGVIRVPSGLKVKAASYASIEKLADSIRPNLPVKKGERFCLDALTIFERTFPQIGYPYRTAGIDEIDECAAFTITSPDGNVVVMREDVYDKLHAENPFGRSTVIHELSHIAQAHPITLYRGATLGGHRFCEDSEWQAKAGTAALMMPLAACQIAKSPQELAAMCGTSVESATYRIKTLVGKLKTLTPSFPLWEYGSERKSPRDATNISGLFGMVNRGLPNHLHTQCLGEDKGELYQFSVDRQAKTSQFVTEGRHVLLSREVGVCSPLHPSPLWSLGVGV